MQGFSGRTVIITGASAGIGAACARKFAAEGANLALVARGQEGLETLQRELATQTTVEVFPTDVAHLPALKRMVKAVQSRFGHIDILVNNAGHNARGGVEEIPVEDLLQIVDVNLRGPIALTRLVLPHLREASNGAIINVASLAGRFPLPHEATYSATKFGLRAFSFALAEELADSDISVSVVSPGPVETGFILDDPENVPDLVFSQPMSSPEEIADLVLACARDGARERACPAVSARLATFAYLLPSVSRAIRPMMEARGRRAKQRYVDDNTPEPDQPLR